MSAIEGVPVLNLANGQPSDSVLPVTLMKQATEKFFSSSSSPSSSDPLNYGDKPETFRECLATFLSKSSLCGEGKEKVDPSLIVPTTGVSHGLDMICTMMCKKHEVRRGESHFVFVEDCTYYLSSNIFKDYGLEVRTVKTDADGVDVDELEQQLKQVRREQEKGLSSPSPLLLYTIPLFNNPTGRCITPKRKRRLLEVTQQYNLLVVSDEVYQMLECSNYIPDTSPSSAFPPMRSLCSSLDLPEKDVDGVDIKTIDNVVALSSFSKILAPGLRVGWIQCSTEEQANDLWSLGLMSSGASSSHFTACLVSELLRPLHEDSESFECLLEPQIKFLCRLYASKYAVLKAALMQSSESVLRSCGAGSLAIEGVDINEQDRVGGYFLWVKLPSWSESIPEAVFKKAQEAFGVVVRLGSECTGNGEGNHDYIRLCFARLEEEELKEAARRLCEMLKHLYLEHKSETKDIM